MTQMIHMNTEIVTKLSSSIKQCANTIDERTRSIKTIMESAVWEGNSRDDLVMQVNALLRNISDLRLEAESLSLQGQREVEQWVQVDQNSIAKYLSEKNVLASSIALLFGIHPNNLRISQYLIGYMMNKEINQIFEYFKDSREGKSFLQEIINSNIRFEFIDENDNISYFGAENGKVIPISWVDSSELSDGAGGGFNNGPPPTIEILDTLESGSAYQLRETIAHEMQHALDYETSRASIDIKYQPYIDLEEGQFRYMTQEEINNYDWSTIEDTFEASCAERVKTEITAHTRGYSFTPLKQTGEGVLNMDNIYTPEEYKIILSDRGYSDVYKQNIRDSFLSQGIDAEVDVYWNEMSNNIQVDIIDANRLVEARVTGYA